MGRVEPGAEENLVELIQPGQFEASALAAWKLAELSRLLGTGIHPRPCQQRVGTPVTEELATHDIEVEIDVMAHKVLGLFRRFQEGVEHLMQGQAIFGCVFGRDTMHHLGFYGDDEPVWLHQQVMVLHKVAFSIMQLPGQLYQSWPVVEIR